MPSGRAGRHVGRAGRGWVREATSVHMARQGTGTTRTTVRLPLSRSNRHAGSARLVSTRRGYPTPGSLGLHLLQRTRCGGQVDPALACLHRQPEAASPGGKLHPARWPDATRRRPPPTPARAGPPPAAAPAGRPGGSRRTRPAATRRRQARCGPSIQSSKVCPVGPRSDIPFPNRSNRISRENEASLLRNPATNRCSHSSARWVGQPNRKTRPQLALTKHVIGEVCAVAAAGVGNRRAKSHEHKSRIAIPDHSTTATHPAVRPGPSVCANAPPAPCSVGPALTT
jgi:hypothetical protein